MKNLILALSLIVSTPAFAQQNELVLAPAYVRYHGYYHTNKKNIGRLPDINGNGYQLAFTYLRNINWVQLGGGVEAGKLNVAQDENYIPARRHTVADPYFVFNALVNGRLVVKKWTFYGGACAGYMIASSHDDYSWGAPYTVWETGEKYTVGGFYKGGQAGASYQLRPNLTISADITARFAYRQQTGLDTNSDFHNPPYNRLNMYNFSIGAHYRF